ncbi:MAG: exodeoxyribonuclease I [Gammaproteobacteria bacterium HGW-Gammaproteobacteria-11]|nr:MAG: exodeoxyribonuclease I [Gammaproteobacteria bacterium HGW-Gammaproteobacteria-11]
MADSFFWYDFESTGIDPRRDRPVQVAGVRTDAELNEIAEPLCIDCRLSDDILPHPMACLVTGIRPQRLASGLSEADFIGRLHAQMIEPGTCSVGYNSLRYDDEMTRFSLYRNFHDPYAREWQGGNSRWDLLEAMRAAHALRPDGIQWPEQEGMVSLRLELLTAANGIDHGQAHDALADVRATIALARCLKAAQPKLFDYLLSLRSKHRVSALIDLQAVRPLVHVSGRFSRERHNLALVMPLAWHPVNRNALIVWDLQVDPQMLTDLTAEQLRERLYTRTEDLAEGEVRPGLKLVHINKCPMLADIKVLRPDDIERLDLDMNLLLARARQVASLRGVQAQALAEIYRSEGQGGDQSDVEQQLYDGFISDADRRTSALIREAEPQLLAKTPWPLQDQRLSDLLFRYRARNYPGTLSGSEVSAWRDFCRSRLSGELSGAPITLAAFLAEIDKALDQVDGAQHDLLRSWKKEALQRAETLHMTV